MTRRAASMKPLLAKLLILILIAAAGMLVLQWRAQKALYARLADYRVAFERPKAIPFPPTNPFSKEKYELGRHLFFDPRLSRAGLMSCATCHSPEMSWTKRETPRERELARAGRARKAPTLLNSAWGWSFFWDGRAQTLEEQALGPIENPAEMDLPIAQAVGRLKKIGEYRTSFENAFPGEDISGATIGKALATFERTILSGTAPFDRWVAGEENAISESAKRGLDIFYTAGDCVKCHSGWNFTNGSFADIGLSSPDVGRGKVDNNPYLQHTFKTPTLRNIASRAPYMHDMSHDNLMQAIELYDRGGDIQRPTSKLFVKPLGLSARQKQDLLAFLQTLTSKDDATAAPPLYGGGKNGEKTWAGNFDVR